MPLYVMLLGTLGLSGLVMIGLTLAFDAPASEPYRIRPEKGRNIQDAKLLRLFSLNVILSVSLIFGVSYGAYDLLFHEEAISTSRFLLEMGSVLIVYDFVYYLAHRFLLHGPIKYFYKIHVLHHTAKYPQAKDSLYVHPVETAIGLLLLMGSTWIVGPIHIISFSVMFGVYSIMNIVVHCGLRVPTFPLNIFSYMARKHDTHHISLKSGNYASITPIFDLILGTAE